MAKKRRKRKNKSDKGGGFERELAKLLSLWWTKNERDDVFWRTAGSGGMATRRAKKGKKTFGQEGDLQATDPMGQPLLNLCTIEAKRGYPLAHVGDTLDRRGSLKNSRPWEAFVQQSIRESAGAEAWFWMLIIRRNSRQAIIYFPGELYEFFVKAKSRIDRVQPWLRIIPPKPVKGAVEIENVFATTLSQFFKRVKRRHVIRVLEALENE